MFKVKNVIPPEIMKELFAPKMSPYDLRNINSFKKRSVNSVWHDIESKSYLGPNIWDLVPNEIKKSQSLNGFKFTIKRWVPEGCLCRIWKIYFRQVGFIKYNNWKLVFSEIKLYVVTIIIVHKCSIISDKYISYVFLLIIVFSFIECVS